MGKTIDNILLDYGNRLLDVANGKENPTMGELIETPKQELYNLLKAELIGEDVHSDFDHDDGYCQNCGFVPTDGSELCICKIITAQRQKQRQKLAELLGVDDE